MRWVNTRSLRFANYIEYENYLPSLDDDCPAASNFKRRPVLFPPSSPPPLAPAQAGEGEPRPFCCLTPLFNPVAWPSVAEQGAHATKQRRKENGEPVCGMLGSKPRLFVTPLRLPGEEKGLGDEVGEHAQFAFCELHRVRKNLPSLDDD